MRRVVDASVLVAALTDVGPAGRWAEAIVATLDLRLARASGVLCHVETPPEATP